jgi:A/G-specific adenine glycosylase
MARTSSTLHTLPQIKPADLRKFHARLAAWYAAHGRHDLPWRTTTDPYPIWLSEVMLQQTQVITVRERFFFPFLKKFPTIEALAKAPPEAVMKAWEGLGYYSRARNLHEAAKLVASSRARPGISRSDLRPRQGIPAQGRDDALREALLALPGVGKNTAHAILAFAYHQPVAILEANVKRVVARVFALETPSDTALWEAAETLLNTRAPFDYNQAMMDVGSLICTPKNPNCAACPAQGICKGQSTPEAFPAPKTRKIIPTREVTIHVREDARGRLFLERREAKLLGGLYGFPQSPHAPSSRRKPGSQAQNEALRMWLEIPACAGMTPVGKVTHTYSHFNLIGHVLHEKIAGTANATDWHSRAEIAALPLSKLDHKVLALIDKCNTSQKKRAKAAPGRRAR